MPLASLAALAVTGGGIALVLASRGADGSVPPPRESVKVVATSIRPSVHAFGEPVVAELVLRANAELVKPETLRVEADFSPYDAAGPASVERLATGSTVRWRFRYPLRCLREGCAPDGDRRTFEFPRPRVAYRYQSSPGPASISFDWPPLQVTARVDGFALQQRAWRADASVVPAPTYRWAPGALAAALLAGTAGFAGLGVGLASRLARRREPAAVEADTVEAPTVTPLERALEASRNGNSSDRRRALERVARELGAQGLVELADRARALAWGSGGADPAAIEDLARDALAAANGRSA